MNATIKTQTTMKPKDTVRIRYGTYQDIIGTVRKVHGNQVDVNFIIKIAGREYPTCETYHITKLERINS